GMSRGIGEVYTRQVKTLLLGAVLCVSVASQNLIPVHIAFIPILIPPLLHVMAKMNIDRRQVACVITFCLLY
ncbi:sodium:proton antiporter, partial [Aeromonas salmonicida]